ncbi:4'-phosphopantetheinyl transferase family protein [Streptomyces anulatus]|uniref:4'-phosphopantetheinyl transferase family protein n=1 Tax=Streptomyces anulatus TaxID=1892 RepID=UPI003B78AAF7
MKGERPPEVWFLRVPPYSGLPPGLLDRPELDDRERRRAASFLRPRDAALYVSAHLALRHVLGTRLGVPSGDVRLTRAPCPGCGGPHGRPVVEGSSPAVRFSLSHSEGMVLVAVAEATVGVDVQRLPGADTVDVCLPSLHPAERAELAREPAGTLCAAFGQLWTRKEAYLKGLGTGLSRSPSLDYLGAHVPRRPDGWTVTDLGCGPHHRAAVALRGAAPAVLPVRRLSLRRLFDDSTADTP